MHNLNRYLIVSDFDGTAFDTFSPSPTGMNVYKAYQLTLDKIFGNGIGEWFFKLFGLRSRTPSEIITAILEWNKELKEGFIRKGREFFDKEQGKWEPIIPESKDGRLNWSDESPQIALTQMLVLQKLKYLLNEVGEKDTGGEMWPKPCEGLTDFLHILQELQQEGHPLDFAVLSSGHESLIRKSFDIWDLPQPRILVTEDDIRSRKYPEEQERRFKPGSFPLALVHQKWLRDQGVTSDSSSFMRTAMESKQRIMCIGDNIETDLFMAIRANIRGYLYPHTPWGAIAKLLNQRKDLLDGRPFSEIISESRNGIETDLLLPDKLSPKYKRGLERV